MLEQGTVLRGRYRILGKLEQGGTGEVYRAEHLKLRVPVAVRALLLGRGVPGYEERRARFEMEGRLLASLSHPSLARVTDFFEDGSTGYLAREYVDGTTLEGVVLERGAMDEAIALDWTLQLLDALTYLHTCTPPVIVRDLKPSNVVVGRYGGVRIVDFGIAGLLEDGQGVHAVGRLAPSGAYAPIELHGMGGMDHRSDLYSLGATLLFMLTGQPPPDAVSRVTRGTRLADPTLINRTVSPVTWNAIRKLMAIPQGDRPASTAGARRLLVPGQGESASAGGRPPGGSTRPPG